MRELSSKPRVLIAKPGLDGHDVGAKLVCRALADAGAEVIYTGLRQSPKTIVKAAAQEDVDFVGLSVLSGSHLPLVREVMAELDAAGVRDMRVIIGGNIPARDHEALRALGVAGVFATGTAFAEITEFVMGSGEGQ